MGHALGRSLRSSMKITVTAAADQTCHAARDSSVGLHAARNGYRNLPGPCRPVRERVSARELTFWAGFRRLASPGDHRTRRDLKST